MFVFCSTAVARQEFELKNASEYFDIKISVVSCEEYSCSGAATFSFYKKGGVAPYQVIKLPETYIQLGEDGIPNVNKTLLYDEQSVVNIGDFNFDGMEDIAICNGTYGSYNGPSYSVYLSSRAAKKFVYSNAFSKLGERLGMFEIDEKRKVLTTFDKDGCCWHVTAEYTVIKGRPVKVLVVEEDATIPDETKVKITTKKLADGKWKSSVKYVKREEN